MLLSDNWIDIFLSGPSIFYQLLRQRRRCIYLCGLVVYFFPPYILCFVLSNQLVRLVVLWVLLNTNVCVLDPCVPYLSVHSWGDVV